jgi:hypothetical protein
LTKLWAFENRHFVLVIYVSRVHTAVGKSNINNLPAPTDLTTQKSAPLVLGGIAVELETTEPIFEKCPHLRD